MKIIGTTTYLSATDLSTHISCKHATLLDLKLAKNIIKPPPVYENPSLEALRTKGEEFENDLLNEFKKSGKTVVEISRDDRKKAVAETLAAMNRGADIIYQARLENDVWNGWADFLVKVERPGKFGDWSYEVMDTKLSKETKAGAILQISLYSEILEQLQGCKPEYMHIKNPTGIHRYRVDDFAAYYRLMKNNLLQAIADPQESYPDPVPYCEICKWWEVCNQKRREDDHLSFVAGIGNMQVREVNKWGITTLESMAGVAIPLEYKPERGSVPTFEKLAHQARLQLQSRITDRIHFEILPLQEEFGFTNCLNPQNMICFSISKVILL